MRWAADPNALGEQYCKGCKKARKSETECAGCPKPKTIYAPNGPVLLVVKMMASQWRYAATGQRIGMDYTALNAVMENYDIDDRTTLFERVRLCEQELLTIQHENQTT